MVKQSVDKRLEDITSKQTKQENFEEEARLPSMISQYNTDKGKKYPKEVNDSWEREGDGSRPRTELSGKIARSDLRTRIKRKLQNHLEAKGANQQ